MDLGNIGNKLFKLIKRYISSSLFKSTGIYIVTNFLNSSIPFLLLPILTRYLSPTDYGIVSMFSITVVLIKIFVSMNIEGAIGRQYFDRGKINFSQYVSNCVIIILIATTVVGFIIYLLSENISRVTSISKNWLISVLIVAFGQSLITINLTWWQVQMKSYYYGIFQVLLTLTNLVLSIIFVVFFSMKWQGRILAQLLSIGMFGFYSVLLFSKRGWLVLTYNREYIKDALKFGLPLIPHSLGGIAIAMTDRFLITNMVSIAETGIYTVGAQIGSIVGLVEDAFNRAWVPWFFGKLSTNNFADKIKIVKITYIYNILIIIFALVLSFMAPYFLKILVGKDFKGAYIYVLWISLGWAFNGMYKMVANYIFYVKKTHILAWITFITGVVNIVISYYLIKLNGTIGAAQGTMIAFFISYVLTFILASKVYKMPWNLKNI